MLIFVADLLGLMLLSTIIQSYHNSQLSDHTVPGQASSC